MTYLDRMQESRCPHGVRDHRTGTNAQGKDWAGMFCPQHARDCQPVWELALSPQAETAIKAVREAAKQEIAAVRAKRDAAIADLLAGVLPIGNAAGNAAIDDEVIPF